MNKWLLLLVVILLNGLATLYADNRKKKVRCQNTDIGYDLLPDLSEYSYVLNNMIIVFLACLILFRINRISNWDSIRDALILLLFFRSICVFSTNLIDAQNKPQKGIIETITIGGSNDKVFSGHTTVSLVMCSILAKLYPNIGKYFFIFAILQAILLVSTRGHYTVDVLLAFMLFYLYTNKTFIL